MKKILLLSVALLSVLFLTFTSCKKKTTTPLSGTTWVLDIGYGATAQLSFAGDGNGATLKQFLNGQEVPESAISGTYTYVSGAGILTTINQDGNGKDITVDAPYVVVDNKLTITANGGVQVFTKK